MDDNIFKTVRKALGLTQGQAARKLGVTQSAVSKREYRKKIFLHEVKALAKASGFHASLALRDKTSGEIVRLS